MTPKEPINVQLAGMLTEILSASESRENAFGTNVRILQLLTTAKEIPSDEIQAGLDHLRILIKYLIFDLEATRRENFILTNREKNQSIDDFDQEE